MSRCYPANGAAGTSSLAGPWRIHASRAYSSSGHAMIRRPHRLPTAVSRAGSADRGRHLGLSWWISLLDSADSRVLRHDWPELVSNSSFGLIPAGAAVSWLKSREDGECCWRCFDMEFPGRVLRHGYRGGMMGRRGAEQEARRWRPARRKRPRDRYGHRAGPSATGGQPEPSPRSVARHRGEAEAALLPGTWRLQLLVNTAWHRPTAEFSSP